MPSRWSSVANRRAKASISSALAGASARSAPRCSTCLGHRDRLRAHLGDRLAGLDRGRQQLLGLAHPVDQADAQRLGRVDHRAAHAQLERAGQADAPQQPLRPAEARDDPELDLGLAELRAVSLA
jgi:hypothetical protein